jgi:DNA invertase Pin-like site-specific DNA recombinase
VLIGYARVSKDEQHLDLQLDALTAAGCERIFTDKESGAKRDRKGLTDALSHLRTGDVFTVWKLDRLGRSTLQLMLLLNDLHVRGVEFRSLTEGLDTTTPFGKFLYTLSAALAELERDRLIERTRAGLRAAKVRGRNGGRPRSLTPEQERHALDLLADGSRSITEVARLLKVSRSTISRIAATHGDDNSAPNEGAPMNQPNVQAVQAGSAEPGS